MTYLERLKNRNTPYSELTKLTEGAKKEENSTCVSSVSTPHGRFQKNAANEAKPIFHGFTLADLEREAHQDEWIQICDNPEAMEAFALALLEDRQIKAGITPGRFTRIVHCPQCGAVPMPPTWPTSGRHDVTTMPTTRSCRWCENRRAGRHYPKAYPLAPNGYNRKQDGPWPWSPDCRPIAWQGVAEKLEVKQ